MTEQLCELCCNADCINYNRKNFFIDCDKYEGLSTLWKEDH